jgi:hypothetical protein
MKRRASIITILVASMFIHSYVGATLITFTTGSGSAVTTIDRSAEFEQLSHDSSFDLSNYTEDGLSITVNDVSFSNFDPFGTGVLGEFYYGSEGNFSYVTIKTVDGTKLSAVEFKVGNAWPDHNSLVWQGWNDSSVEDSGLAAVIIGSVIGWTSSAGFDELRVGLGANYKSFGQWQAIVIDDLKVQTLAVPEPSTNALLLVGLAIFSRARRKKHA